jgi:hypothetical protein
VGEEGCPVGNDPAEMDQENITDNNKTLMAVKRYKCNIIVILILGFQAYFLPQHWAIIFD